MTAPSPLSSLASSFSDALARTRVAEKPPMPFRPFCERVLGMSLSPAVAAIMDASEGLPVTTIDDETSRLIFGCARSGLPRKKPLGVVVVAGGRAGKTSRLGAPKLIHSACTARLSTLAPGETAYALTIAPKTDTAKQMIDDARGLIANCNRIKARVKNVSEDDGEERIGTVTAIEVVRPDGKRVDIKYRAPGAKGYGARGGVLTTFVGEEFAFFYADKKKVVNDRDVLDAAMQRLAMPDAQFWLITTPYYDGVGVAEDLLREHWGKHDGVLVVRAATRALHPGWDPDRVLEREIRKDPERGQREIDARGTKVGSGGSFYAEEEVGRAFSDPYVPDPTSNDARRLWVGREPDDRLHHGAACDLGFRKNSSALVLGRAEASLARLVLRLELKPQEGEPLKPSEVVREFAFWCMRYSVEHLYGDAIYADSAHEELAKLQRALSKPGDADAEQRAWVERVRADEHARRARVPAYVEWSMDAKHVSEAHTEVRRRMGEGRAALPDDESLKAQCRGTTKKVLPVSGQVLVSLSKDGTAHSDVWAAAVILLSELPVERVAAPGYPEEEQEGGREDVGDASYEYEDFNYDDRASGRGFR